jgi:hypothetical protein
MQQNARSSRNAPSRGELRLPGSLLLFDRLEAAAEPGAGSSGYALPLVTLMFCAALGRRARCLRGFAWARLLAYRFRFSSLGQLATLPWCSANEKVLHASSALELRSEPARRQPASCPSLGRIIWVPVLRRNAAARGASLFKMMDGSRHKSVDVLRGYLRDADAFRDHAGAGLL